MYWGGDMFIIESFRRNIWFFTYHLNIWILKVSFVFFVFIPFLTNQNCVTYFSELVLQSNTKGLTEALNVADVPSEFLLGSVIFLVVIFLFFIDTLFEAGFIEVYLKKEKKQFWDSILKHSKKLFKVNGVFILPNSLVFYVLVVLLDDFLNHTVTVFSFLAYSTLFTCIFYLIKVMDSLKFRYLIKTQSILTVFKGSFKSLFLQKKDIWLLNLIYGMSLTCCVYLFWVLKQNVLNQISDTIFISLFVQQSFVLLRQFGRYVYFGVIISMEDHENKLEMASKHVALEKNLLLK